MKWIIKDNDTGTVHQFQTRDYTKSWKEALRAYILHYAPSQVKPVEVIDMRCRGTVEDRMHRVLNYKMKMFKDIVVREKEVWDETIKSMQLARRLKSA